MFELFTDEARRVVVLAQEAARSLDHNHIGTEHLLLGLLDGPDGTKERVLAAHGVTSDGVRDQLAAVDDRGTDASSGHLPFTQRAKKVLELSVDESRALDHEQIRTEHLLLALLREGDGVAVRALLNLGVDLHALRRATLDTITDEPRSPDAPPPVPPIVFLRSEVVRLRQLLTQHGIDPDDVPDPTR